MAIIIKNGNIVTSSRTYLADIRIEGEKITEIGFITPSSNDRVIEAEGKFILPGGIDVHTHLDLDTGTTKTADDFYTGTRAAVAGGTTTVVDFATQSKGGTLTQAMDEWTEKAKDAFCDYGFHMAIVDWNPAIKNEMQDMVEQGIPSFKLYMAYKGSLQVDDGVIYEALKRSREIGGLIGFHCENGDMVAELSKELVEGGKLSPYYHPKSRPDTLEQEAIFRLCEIAELANAPVWVVHLSTEKGLRVIEEKKRQGLKIITETCPQYLLLDDSCYGTEDDTNFEGAKYVISPPLRKQKDIDAMWNGIEIGITDIVSTDHCSFNFKAQKELGKENFTKIPNGGPGLEHRVILLYNFGVVEKKITINQMVNLLSKAPSKIFGLSNKGSISVGKDADITILDPNGSTLIEASTQVQNVDYTPYEGFELAGKIETVFLRGEMLYNKGEFTTDKFAGKFQKRDKGKF